MKAKSEEGLPEIAELAKRKKPIVLVMIGVIAIIFFGTLFHKKSDKKENSQMEETYSLPSAPAVSNNQATVLEDSKPTEAQNKLLTEEQITLIREKQNELQQRLVAPLMIVNNSQPTKTAETNPANSSESDDRNTQYQRQVSSENVEKISATQLSPLNLTVAEGSLIHAILESATNSDLPGRVRAIVSEPTYSEDGSQILIPRGSRLIGQYKSGMLQGQSRIFMVWTRLITPNGISVQIGSPDVDSLGVAGLGADEIDRHFWQRFGTASLLSIIGAGTANVGVSGSDQENSASVYRTAVANSFSKSAEQSLQQDGRIPPTLMTYQGKPIIVFVAKDLSFQDSMKQVKPKINIL